MIGDSGFLAGNSVPTSWKPRWPFCRGWHRGSRFQFRHQNGAVGPAVSPCLMHGDLYARHLLLDESFQLSRVIDWGDLHAGDGAVDLAVAWLVAEVRQALEWVLQDDGA